MVATGILADLATRAVAPDVGRQALGGYVAGFIAVLVYDSTRMPFVVVGGWPPILGMKSVDDRIDRRLSALAYGAAIWIGLVTVLITAPDGQQKLFHLTPVTIAVSLAAHLVYGAVLGLLTNRRSIAPSVVAPLRRHP